MKRGLQVSHTGFIVVFCGLLYAICNTLNIDKLSKWFHHSDRLDAVALSGYLLAGLCLFTAFFTLLAHRRTIKPLAILLTVLSAAATYFIAKYDVAIDRSMVMNTVHTDATEVWQLLSPQMIPYVVFLIIAPVLLIWSLDIGFEANGRYLFASARLVVITVCVALAALYLNFNAIHRAGNISNKYIVYSLVPVNVISGGLNALGKSLKPHLATNKKPVEISASVAAPGNLVVVLAVGESSRRKNFSLYGYTRQNTNPVLQNTSGLHLLNAIATRGSTLYALPQILEKKDVKLTQVVAKAGVPTACYVNYTLYDNCEAVGETKVSNCKHGDKCYDEDVIPLLEANLKTREPGYGFVVLHLGGGSHGPTYGDRHPPEFKKFEPMCNDADVANRCTLEQLYNSYDNTILYVDHVLGQIIQTLDRSGTPYVFIYLSDHGESLLEDGVMFHGMPPGVPLPKEQAEIPLIVKASVPLSIAARESYQQPDVFDTVLDLFTIRSPLFDRAGSFIQLTPDSEFRTSSNFDPSEVRQDHH
ncbi:phosphoethanolamine transferase [Steroidobacter sp.]|uniref:phosphoethanolamine transferase n=1 Tax=Steroidobacter sp. TaxID=1978227 RepID=UPI0025E59A7B|nr:sulfatase-like hydrolase/transferase [Steroidobacter sp.]